MKRSQRRILLSSLVPVCFFSLPGLAALPPGRAPIGDAGVFIRVRLGEALPSTAVRGFDLKIYDSKKNGDRRLVSAPDRVSDWQFHCQDGRIRATALRETGGKRTYDLQEPVIVSSQSGVFQFDNRTYRNELRIHSAGSFCEVVNHVDLEKYLNGLVNSEFSARWNEESVSAQVIAARTYAYHRIRQVRAQAQPMHYDLDATDRDQVYDGAMGEDFRAYKSVERTRGMVLVAGNGALPIKAFYHSTCGGMTELPEHVWKTKYPGFKRKVSCPFCTVSPRYKWETDLGGNDLRAIMLKRAKNVPLVSGWPANWNDILKHGKLISIEADHDEPMGRVLRVRTFWQIGGVMKILSLPGTRFRDWLGAGKLKSTVFEPSMIRSGKEPRWKFQGRGSGHGVGMCQWGAKVMGEKGYTASAILKHYYPDANLRKVW